MFSTIVILDIPYVSYLGFVLPMVFPLDQADGEGGDVYRCCVHVMCLSCTEILSHCRLSTFFGQNYASHDTLDSSSYTYPPA